VTLPGFTAKTSISHNHRGHSHHQPISSSRYEPAEHSERITLAAPYWGPFRRENCVPGGLRKYSSIIYGVDWGYSWEAACANTPAYITNADGSTGTYHAVQCDNQGFNMWGVFHVPERSCQSGGSTPRLCSCSYPQYENSYDCITSGGSWCCDNGDGTETCTTA
jgi:hypothetical protein